ncbi:MAG: sigma-70 family RNA polymerase sigma factor [Propionibacteriaceae bacterium]
MDSGDDFSLLTWSEEVRLARAIEAGLLARFARETGRPPVGASEAELVELERLGNAAHRRMVAANLRLVSVVVGRSARLPDTIRTDLFQDGCVGLIEAVRRFDHARGYRFATYALHRIRAAVTASAFRAQALGGLTAARVRELRRLRWAESELSQRLGRSATAPEVAVFVGRDPDWVGGLLEYEVVVPIEVVADELIDQHSEDPLGFADVGRALLERLTPAHRQVIELRCGFADDRTLSLREVAETLNSTLGVVRRLEREALAELRAHCPYAARTYL